MFRKMDGGNSKLLKWKYDIWKHFTFGVYALDISISCFLLH